MGDTEQPTEAQRFVRLWDDHAARVQAYALRRVGPDLAEEVLAETFLVAWRRLADVPGEPLPWLLVVARNTISADRRSRYRARAVEQEIARLAELSGPTAAAESVVVERNTTLRALASLSSRQREALLLVSWDGLSNDEAAAVTGCSPATFRVRLHRARERLRRAADDEPAPARPATEPVPISGRRTHAEGTTP